MCKHVVYYTVIRYSVYILRRSCYSPLIAHGWRVAYLVSNTGNALTTAIKLLSLLLLTRSLYLLVAPYLAPLLRHRVSQPPVESYQVHFRHYIVVTEIGKGILATGRRR